LPPLDSRLNMMAAMKGRQMARKPKKQDGDGDGSEETSSLKTKRKLSDKDRAALALELAEVGELHDEKQAEYKSMQKKWRGDLAALHEKRKKLQKQVHTGFEEIDAQDSLPLEA
jgi:hypothetical protein